MKLSIIIVINFTFALLSVGRSAREGMHYTAWEEEEGFLFLLLPSAYTIITEGHSDESIHIFIHSVILSNLSNIYNIKVRWCKNTLLKSESPLLVVEMTSLVFIHLFIYLFLSVWMKNLLFVSGKENNLKFVSVSLRSFQDICYADGDRFLRNCWTPCGVRCNICRFHIAFTPDFRKRGLS